MAGVKEQVGLDIQINGQKVPQGANTFGNITLVQNPRYPLPFLSMHLADTTGRLSGDMQIAEGTKVQARFYRFSEDNATKFHDFLATKKGNNQRSPEGTTPQHWICMLDAPKYWGSVQPAGVQGTSAEAIKKIAAMAGLKAKCDPTSDSQAWLNGNASLYGFAKSVTAHGYANASSAMLLGCDVDKTLHYIDAVARMEQEPKLRVVVGGGIGTMWDQMGFPSSSDGTVTGEDGVREVFGYETRMHSTSGESNALFNYGFTQHADSVGGSIKSVNTYKAKRTAGKLAMNPELKAQVGVARVSHLPLNFGNTHPRYEEAVYQNARGLALFSEVLMVMVNTLTYVNLFDIVEVRMTKSPDDVGSLYDSGRYLVFAKGQYLKNGKNYVEKLMLVRAGSKQVGSTPMV